MVKIMRYFFDNEGIFLRAVARNTGREGCVGVFFYGLSPAIRDGGVSWECFFYGLSPAIRDGGVNCTPKVRHKTFGVLFL